MRQSNSSAQSNWAISVGISISFSTAWKNANRLISERRDWASILNATIFALSKQDPPIDSTDRGMHMDPSDACSKHESSIRLSVESSSKLKDPIAEFSKQHFPRYSTDRGTQIDMNEAL
jgi:hypothetical protein